MARRESAYSRSYQIPDTNRCNLYVPITVQGKAATNTTIMITTIICLNVTAYVCMM